MRKRPKLVCGVGINDATEPTSRRINGVMTHSPCYKAWHNMLNRCYSGKYPDYNGVSVCDEWLVYSNFKSWWDVNHVPGYALDKDLKIPGNKVYGPDTCLYIPVWMNTYIASKSKHARGVTYDKRLDRYKAQRSSHDKRGRYIGYFDTAELAHEAWLKDHDSGLAPDIDSLDISLREIFLKWKSNQNQEDI